MTQKHRNNTTQSDIIEWLWANQSTINVILTEMNYAKSKLLEMEPSVFHDDIETEFYDMATQKIADLITKDLAIPIEMVYNIVDNNKSLIDNLSKVNL